MAARTRSQWCSTRNQSQVLRYYHVFPKIDSRIKPTECCEGVVSCYASTTFAYASRRSDARRCQNCRGLSESRETVGSQMPDLVATEAPWLTIRLNEAHVRCPRSTEVRRVDLSIMGR